MSWTYWHVRSRVSGSLESSEHLAEWMETPSLATADSTLACVSHRHCSTRRLQFFHHGVAPKVPE